jgi:uncharacterized protein (TIGR02611 family)
MGAESDERRKAAERTSPPPAAGGGSAGRRALGSRAPKFVLRSRALHLSWRVGVFLVGLAVVVGGILLLPLPGPGWLVIFAGVAIWATEFVWAQIVLRWTQRKVMQATRRALDPEVRRRNVILGVIALVVCAAGLAAYLWNFGFVAPWRIDE